MTIQDWTLLIPVVAFLVGIVICTARLSVHTQQRLAAVNQRDWLIDGLVWINRHTSRRPR